MKHRFRLLSTRQFRTLPECIDIVNQILFSSRQSLQCPQDFLGLAGAIYLLAFFVWGSQDLGATSAGKRAAGLWGSVAAYSTALSVARCGVQLAFAVGKPEWASVGLSHEILALIGLARAPDALGIILVMLQSHGPTCNAVHFMPSVTNAHRRMSATCSVVMIPPQRGRAFWTSKRLTRSQGVQGQPAVKKTMA